MGQWGFDDLLSDAAEDNAARRFEKETAHLPEDWADAVDYHHNQIARHHAAMMKCDFESAQALRQDAYLLARKLNGNAPGILAGDDTPGCKLTRTCATKPGDIPLWGQDGDFPLDLDGMAMHVEMGGMFGIGATAMPYLGFSVRAMDKSQPFLSATGYRSFLGVSVPPEPGMTTDGFVCRVLRHHIAHDLSGKLVRVSEAFEQLIL